MDGRLVAGCLLLLNIAAVHAVPEYHRVRTYQYSMYADEDVMIDPEENYALITVSKIHGMGTPTVNLHDFVSGYSAYKDVENGRCYIHHSQHTFAELSHRLHEVENAGGHTNITQFFSCVMGSMIPPSDMYQFGTKVARFCQNYESYLINTPPATIWKRSAVTAGFWCFICIFSDC